MKLIIKERRKSHHYIFIALVLILILAIIFINKYLALQEAYYKVLSKTESEIQEP